jgi:hypothetical protein
MVLIISLLVIAAQADVGLEENGKLLGNDIKVEQRFKKSSAAGGLQSTTDILLLGKDRSLVRVQSEPQVFETGETKIQNDLYVAGMRIWSGGGTIENKGYSYEGLIAPTQIAWPLVTYPLGPVLLQIDAGVNYQASLKASAIPGVTFPLQSISLKTSLDAKVAGAGYLEGYAKFILVRGGVGGSIELIDGHTLASVESELSPVEQDPISEPEVKVTGKLTILKGRIYGFVDTYRMLTAKWKRSLNKNFFVYPGKCWAFGEEKCETP